MEELRRALQDDPRLVAAHNSLGLAYKAQGRIAQALEEFLTAIRLDPDISCSYNNVASLLFDQLGRYEEAMRWFRKAIEVDPDSECGRAAKGNLDRLMSLSSKGRQEKD